MFRREERRRMEEAAIIHHRRRRLMVGGMVVIGITEAMMKMSEDDAQVFSLTLRDQIEKFKWVMDSMKI